MRPFRNWFGRVGAEPPTPSATPGDLWRSPGSSRGEQIPSPDGGVMIWVPPGEFFVGSTHEDIVYALDQMGFSAPRLSEMVGDPIPSPLNEYPAHHVRMKSGFWLGKYEVTNEQYRSFCHGRRVVFPRMSGNGRNHPVVDVTWFEAKAYCENYGAALPTPAQWEYAARGSQGLRYPWGNYWDASRCCNNHNRGTGDPPTVEVGSLAAGDSWCGACDMSGNVWEWCEREPKRGAQPQLRGGSWMSPKEHCRSAAYSGNDPSESNWSIGFRLVVTPTQEHSRGRISQR